MYDLKVFPELDPVNQVHFERYVRHLDLKQVKFNTVRTKLWRSGVRRSGKTTLLFQTIKYLIDSQHVPPRNILFVNCDEPEISSLENPLSKVVDTYRKEIPAKGITVPGIAGNHGFLPWKTSGG